MSNGVKCWNILGGYAAGRGLPDSPASISGWGTLSHPLRMMVGQLSGASPASLRMSHQRTRDTEPELVLRRELHARGMRYPVADSLHTHRRGAALIYPITELAIDESDTDLEIPTNSCILAIRIVVPSSTRRRDTPYVGFKVQIEDQADEIIVTDPEGPSVG